MTESAVPGLLDTRGHLLRSTRLDREVALTVWLPPSYESSEATYPVVYVLDAPMLFAFAAQGALITIFDEAMPEVVVVGVGEPLTSAYQWGENRTRDYTPRPVPDDPASGQAGRFFDALQQEIVPLVDGQYRTDPSDRILWGHSFGGAFGVVRPAGTWRPVPPGHRHESCGVRAGSAAARPGSVAPTGSQCAGEPVHLDRVAGRRLPPRVRLGVRPAQGARLRRSQVRDQDHPGLWPHRGGRLRVSERAQVGVPRRLRPR